MRRTFATILRFATLFIGIGGVVLLLWEPHHEGRNAHATLAETYLRDPFLAFVYVGSIPFFVATYHAFRLLGWAGARDPYVSQRAAHVARVVKACAGVTIGFIAAAVAILMFVGDEKAVAMVLGVLATLPVLIVGASPAVYDVVRRGTVD